MAPTDVLPEGFHANSVIAEVPLSNIQIDRSYQRDPSQTLIEQIADKWDEVASELVLISSRGDRLASAEVEGGLFLVNGQHRTLAARKLNHETIWARIVDLSHVEDPGAVEAELRLKTNVRLGDRPLERFKAQVRAGDPQSLDIIKLLARFDTEINSSPTTEVGINCVSTIEGIYELDDGHLLVEVLEIMKETFGGFSGKNASAAMFKGLGWFVEKHGIEADRSRLIEKLKITGAEQMYRRAVTMQSTMGGSLWMNYYRVIVDFYNDQLREKSRLGWQLRGAGSWKKGGGQANPSQAGRNSSGNKL